MSIRGVVFDVDDTLYDMAQPFYAALRRLFGERAEFDLPALFLAFRQYSDERFEESQTGKISMDEFYIYRIRMTLQEADVQTTDAQALAFQRVYMGLQYQIKLSPIMVRLLTDLRTRVKLGIITNGESAHQRKKIASLGISKWMKEETIIISGDHKFHKPDQRIFQLMAERMEVDGAQLLYVGDAFDLDVVGAVEAGWNAVWFNRRGRSVPQTATGLSFSEVPSEEKLLSVVMKAVRG